MSRPTGDDQVMLQPALRLAQLKPSPIRILSEGAPPSAIPLGLGEPTWDLPQAAMRALRETSGPCPYGPNFGLPELRDAVAHFHGATRNEVLITCGSEGALFSLFLAFLNPGDEVLVPDPYFPAYTSLAHLAGAKAVTYPLDTNDRFRLKAAPLLAALEANPNIKAVVVNSPSNPTGGATTPDDLRRIAEACKARGVMLISDEVYIDLHYGTRPPSLRDVSDYGLVITSVSKGWGAAGLRVGWILGDPEWLGPARTVHGYAVTGASHPAQRAALALLEDSESIFIAARREIRVRWEALAAALKLHLGQIVTPPDGAFYHWIELPKSALADPMAFCIRLRDEGGVVVVPGSTFGPQGKRFARLSFAAFPEQITEGVSRMAPFWNA